MNDLIRNDIEINNVPLLVGNPGTGVVTRLETFIKDELKAHYFNVSCRTLISIDDLSMAIQHATFYADGHAGETTILILDEINHANKDITKTVLSIPTTRKVGDITLPTDLKVVMVCNIYEYDDIAALIPNENIVVYKIEK